MKRQINFRASDLTARQLSELAARWGTSQTETVTVCIDRAWQQEQELASRLAAAGNTGMWDNSMFRMSNPKEIK